MWKSSNIQIVWFAVNADSVDAPSAYKALTGNEVDGFEKNRVPSQKSPFLSRAFGVTDSKSSRVQVSPGRVDWFIEPQSQDDDLPYEKLLDTKAAIESARETIEGLAGELIGDVTRVSVVTRLIREVATPDEANHGLVEICGIPLAPEGLKDLAFQANKRKRLTSGVEINRLARFSIETASVIMLAVNQNTGQAVQTSPQKNEKYAVRVDLDFNTVPSGTVFGIAQQKELFGALFDETLAASEKPSIDIFNK